VSVPGKVGLMVILVAGGLGFIIALAGSPGIGSSSREVIHVSVVAINEVEINPAPR
jgi:hypothetical protein